MNKNELALLRDCINKVTRADKASWEELKLQIHSHGYQTYYPAQDWFKEHAMEAVFALSDSEKKLLISEWKKIPRLIKRETDEEILKQYALVVVEKVVERAMAAASRTCDWPADFDGYCNPE
ncbi:MAG: hypothetical protein ABIH42_09655 [Planctomycetota bacterium]